MRIATAFIAILIMVSCGSAKAMQFSLPVLIGGFQGKVRESPYNYQISSRDGQYFDFGSDKQNLLRVYGRTAGGTLAFTSYDQVGPMEKPNVKFSCFPHEIFEIQSDIGTRFYVIFGQGSDGCCLVDIFGKEKNGKFVKYLSWRDLEQYRWHPNTGSLGNDVKIYVKQDTIILDCSRARDEKWQYILKWDDSAQWFGIEYREL